MLDIAQVFSVRLRSGVTLVGQISLPRQFPGGGHLMRTLEQVDKLLSVKCPPAFLRIETLHHGQRLPYVVGTNAIEAIVPANDSVDQDASVALPEREAVAFV